MAAGVVTRWPSLNSTGKLSASNTLLMALPPPWTMTTFTPRILSSTMSLMTSARSFSSTMAAPPYFTTTVLPVMFLIHGSASNSTWPVRSSVSFARLLVSTAYFMQNS